MAENCKISKYLFLLLLALGMTLSCTREPIDAASSSDEGQVTAVVHYLATAGETVLTKASLNGLQQYIFESEDKLYVTSGENMYGILHLVAGAGSTTATFEGDLMCLNDFTPNDSTPLSATLVSPSDKVHTVSQSKVTGTSYPESGEYAFVSDFPAAVRSLSDFTGDSTYAAHAFSLVQHSAFLLFSITFSETEPVSVGETITAVLKNSNGTTTLRTGTVTTADNDFSVQASFVAAMPTAITLDKAEISFTKADATPISTDSDIAATSSLTLQANRYYDISRSHYDLDFFTIQAKENGTTVTFGHTGNGIQYKINGSGDWTSYDGSEIHLDQKDFVQFRGQKDVYGSGNENTVKLFTADKTCYVYGDLMSLCCDSGYTPKNTVTKNAFRFALKGATWVDIPAGRPLRLSATNLTGTYNYAQMFSGCTSLTHAPELPAITLTEGAYDSMFDGCTSLVAAPDLPATTVGKAAYLAMFKNCTALTGVPAELKGTSTQQVCQSMFQGCSSLTTAPALPSETVEASGYRGMFQGCISLVRAPQLPASTIGNNCYREMFMGCTSLVQGPSTLPATSLTSDCYRDMFNGCTALSSVPVSLPAEIVPENAYRQMFYGCISLNRGPDLSTVTSIGNYGCYSMFNGCTSLVSFTGLDNASTLENAACCARMFYNCGELTATPEKLPATSVPIEAYKEMYYGCAKITRAPKILATEAADSSGDNQGAFQNMFYGCRRLATPPPTLAIESVPKNCYRSMFQGCIALASAPDLSAMTSVGQYGCRAMFYNCSVLRTPPVLPATTLAASCYEEMFSGAGIESAPSLNAQTLFDYCYKKMFNGCKYLKGPVLLPATELVKECYREMFDGAKLLDAVITLAAKTKHSAENCTTNWLNNVSATGTFIRPEGVDDWAPNNASGIPKGWTPQDFGIEPIFPEDPFDPEEGF